MGLEMALVVLVKLEINVFIFFLMEANGIFICVSPIRCLRRQGLDPFYFCSPVSNLILVKASPPPLLQKQRLNNYLCGCQILFSSYVWSNANLYICFVYVTMDL